MATLTLRNVIGRPLTNTEVDTNFTNLNDDISTRVLTTDYTGAIILSKLITVDGATSGLDADLLDGLEGAAYPKLSASNAFVGNNTFTGDQTLIGDQIFAGNNKLRASSAQQFGYTDFEDEDGFTRATLITNNLSTTEMLGIRTGDGTTYPYKFGGWQVDGNWRNGGVDPVNDDDLARKLWVNTEITNHVPTKLAIDGLGIDAATLDGNLPSAFATAGHTHVLNDLTDVNAPTPTDTYILSWDATSSKWLPVPGTTFKVYEPLEVDIILDGAAPTPKQIVSSGTFISTDDGVTWNYIEGVDANNYTDLRVGNPYELNLPSNFPTRPLDLGLTAPTASANFCISGSQIWYGHTTNLYRYSYPGHSLEASTEGTVSQNISGMGLVKIGSTLYAGTLDGSVLTFDSTTLVEGAPLRTATDGALNRRIGSDGTNLYELQSSKALGVSDIRFTNGGLTCYILTTSGIAKHTLTVAYDLTTMLRDVNDFANKPLDAAIVSGVIMMSADGTHLMWSQGFETKIYSLTTAWDPSVATLVNTLNWPYSMVGFAMDPSGTHFVAIETTIDDIHHITLPTPWIGAQPEGTPPTYTGLPSQNPSRIKYNHDGTRLYVYITSNSIGWHEYPLSTPYDISTIGTVLGNLGVIVGNTDLIWPKDDGTSWLHYDTATANRYLVEVTGPLSTYDPANEVPVYYMHDFAESIMVKYSGVNMGVELARYSLPNTDAQGVRLRGYPFTVDSAGNNMLTSIFSVVGRVYDTSKIRLSYYDFVNDTEIQSIGYEILSPLDSAFALQGVGYDGANFVYSITSHNNSASNYELTPLDKKANATIF